MEPSHPLSRRHLLGWAAAGGTAGATAGVLADHAIGDRAAADEPLRRTADCCPRTHASAPAAHRRG